jgi:hypothetical protein
MAALLRWLRCQIWRRRIVKHPYGTTTIPAGVRTKDIPF